MKEHDKGHARFERHKGHAGNRSFEIDGGSAKMCPVLPCVDRVGRVRLLACCRLNIAARALFASSLEEGRKCPDTPV